MIFVVVPAYNEAATVGLLLWKVRQVFTSFPREYQLLVVDDGSSDGTDDVLAPYARALPLTLVTHETRQGYGRSVEELLRLAVSRTDRPRRDLAIVLQADFSDSPDDIPELVRRIESGADLALADYRRRPGLPWREAVARRLLALAGPRPAAGGPSLDYGSTLKAIRLGTLARVLSERGSRPLMDDEAWGADARLLLAVARRARRVDVVPITRPASPRLRPSRLRPLAWAWAAWRVLRHRDGEAPRAARAEPAPAPKPGAKPGAAPARAAARSRRRRRGKHGGRGGGGGRRDGGGDGARSAAHRSPTVPSA